MIEYSGNTLSAVDQINSVMMYQISRMQVFPYDITFFVICCFLILPAPILPSSIHISPWLPCSLPGVPHCVHVSEPARNCKRRRCIGSVRQVRAMSLPACPSSARIPTPSRLSIPTPHSLSVYRRLTFQYMHAVIDYQW